MTATSEHTHKQKEQRYRKEKREMMGFTRREGVIQWGSEVPPQKGVMWTSLPLVHSRLFLIF